MTHPVDTLPGPSAPVGPPPRPGVSSGEIHPLRAALGHWRLLLTAAVVCAGLAWLAASRYSVRVWQARCAVLYAPSGAGRLGRSGYAPPGTTSVVSMLKCRANLQALSDEFHLDHGAEQLERAIRVTLTPNSEVIEVSCDWSDPQVAAALLNRLLALHAERVNDMRRQQLTTHAGALEEIQARARERRQDALTAHDAVLAEAGVVDLVSERDRAEKDLSEAQNALTMARTVWATCQAQARDSAAALARLEDATAPAVPDEAAAAQRVRRDQLLANLREQELRYAEARSQADAKERELERLEPLVRQRVVTELEFVRARDERDLFALKAEHASKALQEHRQALAALPKEAALSRKATATALWLAAEEKAKAARGEVTRAEARVAEKQRRCDTLIDLARRVRPLARQVEDADKEYREVTGEAMSLEEARQAEQNDLVVVTPARPPEAPAASSRGRILAAGFGIPMLGLVGLLTGVEVLRRARRPESAARGLGLPVVARGLPAGDRAVESRRVALRLCDQLGDANIVALTAAGSGEELDSLAGMLAHYLALRGNRVLLLDARPPHPSATPLLGAAPTQREIEESESALAETPPERGALAPTSDVAQRLLAQDDASGMIERTAHAQIDRLPLGGGEMTADLLASRQMVDLFDGLATTYTRVVVLAPSLAHALEAELTLTHADSVFVLFGANDRSVSPAVADLVRSLIEAGVPLSGAVVLPN